MNTIRATFFICATILASVSAVIYYGYQQDQYVITSTGAFVSIFDKKSKTINICDKGNCNLITPTFGTPALVASPASQMMNPQQAMQPGQRLLGSFPQPQAPANQTQMAGGAAPQQMGQPQVAGGNPQMNPQAMGQPQMAGGNPQLMQQLQQMEMMAQQMDNQPMNPQKMQQIRQRRMLEDQALGNNLLNPQMVQQIRQRRTMEDQQLAQMQQGGMAAQQGNPGPQMVSGTPQGVQAQMTGGAPGANQAAATPAAANGAADETATEDTAADDTAADNTAADNTAADDTNAEPAAKTDDAAPAEEAEEETAPV